MLVKTKMFHFTMKDDSEDTMKLIIFAKFFRYMIFWYIKNLNRNAKGTEKGTRVPILEKERSRNAFPIFRKGTRQERKTKNHEERERNACVQFAFFFQKFLL